MNHEACRYVLYTTLSRLVLRRNFYQYYVFFPSGTKNKAIMILTVPLDSKLSMALASHFCPLKSSCVRVLLSHVWLDRPYLGSGSDSFLDPRLHSFFYLNLCLYTYTTFTLNINRDINTMWYFWVCPVITCYVSRFARPIPMLFSFTVSVVHCFTICIYGQGHSCPWKYW